MRFGKSLTFAAMIFFALFFSVASARAQEPGRHPAYLRALSDLHLMRAYLDRLTPNERVDADSQHAIDEIDAAMREIREAAIDDGKDPHFHPPIDARITPANRFRKAREAGNAAWHDLDREEDNGYAHGLKHRAMAHIEEANHTVDRILRRFE